MPTTTKLALPYPAPADPADVPLDMKKLADRVDLLSGSAGGIAALGGDGKVPLTQLPLIGASPSYDITLPSAPADGQEAILVDSITNPSWQWRLRYNAGSSSPYKWEFIGGAPKSAQTANTGTPDGTITPNNTWVNVGPGLTMPRNGDYFFGAQTSLQRTVPQAASNIYVGISSTIQVIARVPDGSFMPVTVLQRLNSLIASGPAFVSVYAEANGGVVTYNTSIQATPIRIA